MPSRKPTKPLKKPGKAPSGRVSQKAASPKKAVRPHAAPQPMIATSKVPVKPIKPVSKPSAKPAAAKSSDAKEIRAKPTTVEAEANDDGLLDVGEKLAPIKFDTRPLVVPTRPQSDDDGEVDPTASASLLAGPRNVKPYIARRGEEYMNKEQLEHFALILQNWKRDLMVEVDRTVLHMMDEAANFPDPNDRATQEEEFSLELRTRDRERKLIRKIDEALKRIEDGSYGYCLETGEEIGIKRLEARPVATLSVEAQERRERREKQYGDRDDRYR